MITVPKPVAPTKITREDWNIVADDINNDVVDHIAALSPHSGHATLSGGKIPITELGGAGGSSSNFLRGDGTWQIPVGDTITKDTKLGSDCTGSDSDINRVLTLSNTATTKAVLVNVSGAMLLETVDYTVVHNATDSTITFLNKLWNNQYIEVVYFT